MLKKSPKHVWSEVGASHQDSTYPYSAMRGGLENMFDPEEFEKDQKQRTELDRKNSIETRARKAGL